MRFASFALLPWLVALFVAAAAFFLVTAAEAPPVWPARWRRPARQLAVVRHPGASLLVDLRPSRRLRARRWLPALRAAALILLAVALLRPQTGRQPTRIWSQGVDIILALDTSRSMEALDLDPDKPIAQRRSRLKVVREVVAHFIERRPDDQIGLVVFGGESRTHCPLTLDHGIVATLLAEVVPGMAGDQTAIGQGLATAVRRLSRSPARSKVIILLTDGSNNAGAMSPKKAAELALALGIKVYTVGAGGRGQAPFLVDSMFGKQVQYANVDIDEEALREIATISHGAYFRAEDGRALEAIYEHIDALEKTELTSRGVSEHQEAFFWPLGLAVALLAAERLLAGTWLRRLP